MINFSNKIVAQNKFTVRVNQPDIIKEPTIDGVTVSSNNTIQIFWEVLPNDNISYFNIYRETADPDDGWLFLASVPCIVKTSYTDATSFPFLRSYKYKVSAVDFCGNEKFSTTNHQSIKLSVTRNSNDTFILNWSNYEGFAIDKYNIYRGTDINNMQLIAEVDSNISSTTDYKNSAKDFYYMIEAKPLQYDSFEKASGSNFINSRSNVVNTNSSSTESNFFVESDLYIIPNPLSTHSVIFFPYTGTDPYDFKIFDINGLLIYSDKVRFGEVELSKGDMKEGLYFLQIEGNKHSYRGKLVVKN